MQRTVLFISLSFLLVACVPPQQATPFPSPTLENTPVPTATTVWFPATETPVILPTVMPSPTPDFRPGIGSIILSDTFLEDEYWSLARGSNSSAGIANEHLTLTTSGNRAVLFTTRNQPILGDFYMEVTADVNICSGHSEFGVMVRITGQLDQYRFGISCDGQAHVDRIYKRTASAFAPWEEFGFISTLAPSTATLGVWADGQELRFFVDGHYLFSVRDTILYRGSLGLYVRSGDGSPVSINFSQLEVFEIFP